MKVTTDRRRVSPRRARPCCVEIREGLQQWTHDGQATARVREHSAWERLCREIETADGDLHTDISFVSAPEYEGLSISELTDLGLRDSYQGKGYLFVVDQTALADVEHPILVLDLWDEPGRSFRVIPREMWGIEDNLSISNMDFAEFADSADADGVFRGFPDE